MKANRKRSSILTMLTGVVFGFGAAYIFFFISSGRATWTLPVEGVKSYLRNIPLSHDEGPSEMAAVHYHGGGYEDMVARQLSKKVRLLCWILTQPSSHETKARHVKNTWGKRCNYLVFMSTEADYSLPAVKLNVKEGHDFLWAKTKASFKYVYQHYMDRVDWVLKADDDTYVIVENLRYILSQQNSSEKLYLGCRFKPYVKIGYMSGGAGYVLSREAVKAFVEQALPSKHCRQDDRGSEDVEMGKCLEYAGVKVVDSRDNFGRHTFFPLPPAYFLVPKALPSSNWFWKYTYYPLHVGFDCCSDVAISFHYISPNEMYVFEFFVYHVRPYGINHNFLETQASKEPYYLEFGSTSPTEKFVAKKASVDNKPTSHVSEDNIIENTIQ